MVIMAIPTDRELGTIVQGFIPSEPLDLDGGWVAVVQANQFGGLSDSRIQVVDVLRDRGAC